MNFTFNEVFKYIIPHISENLVSSEVIALITKLNEKFPADLISIGHFECPLGINEPVADFSFVLNGWTGREILAGSKDRVSKDRVSIDTSLFKSSVWRQLRCFCQMWSLPEGLLYKNTSNLWLEFDLKSIRKKTPVPGVFFRTSNSVVNECSLLNGGIYNWIIEGLECLRGKPLKKDIKDKFIYCLNACPDNGRLTYAALMLSRPVDAVRAVLAIPDEKLKDYLTDIKYAGDIPEVMELVSELNQFTHLRYNLDISQEVLPKIGIECFLIDKTKNHEEIWANALNHFLKHYPVNQEKIASLLSWIGHTYTTLPYESEPSYILRRINHIKVICEKDKPVTVKVYPEFSKNFEIDILYEKLLQECL